MNNQVRQVLRDLVATQGSALCNPAERVKLEGLLRDNCKNSRKEIFVLVAAHKDGIPAELLAHSAAHHTAIDPKTLVQQLAGRLQDNTDIEKATAQWAVMSWALALGVITLPVPNQQPVPKPSPTPVPAPIPPTGTCRTCSRPLPPGAIFCPDCTKPKLIPIDTTKCPQCDGDVSKGALFCPSCGLDLNQTTDRGLGWRRSVVAMTLGVVAMTLGVIVAGLVVRSLLNPVGKTVATPQPVEAVPAPTEESPPPDASATAGEPSPVADDNARCDAGEAVACSQLGDAYHQAGDLQGAADAYSKAANAYSQACTAGTSDACDSVSSIGVKYTGIGNDKEAARLYTQACLAKSAIGCYNSALAYAQGRGEEQNPGLARDLFNQACSQYHYQRACDALK